MEVQESDIISWDDYFINIAVLSAKRSKDKNTKVGACIVNNNKLLSIGYNGAPKGFPDNEVPTCRDLNSPLEEQKYSYIVHAETNAILNYSGSNKDMQGGKIYVTMFPCHECAKLLVQVGIKEIIYLDPYSRTDNTMNMAKLIFNKCGISYRKLEVEK